MRAFDFQQLRTFVAVADAGSLSAAAPRLHLTQSTISEQVRKLEERAGLALFRRSPRGVQLTEGGRRLLDHARRLVLLNETAFEDLQGRSAVPELSLGIAEYFEPAQVAAMLACLRARWPRLVLHVHAMKSEQIVQAHAGGALDLGITLQAVDDAFVPAQVLRFERLCWFGTPGFFAAVPRPLPLVLMPPGCVLHRVATTALQRAGIPHAPSHTGQGLLGLRSVLAAGLGVACLPLSAAGPGLVVAPAEAGLPRLPDVAFTLTGLQPGESATTGQARALLKAWFEAGGPA